VEGGIVEERKKGKQFFLCKKKTILEALSKCDVAKKLNQPFDTLHISEE
jgi:hypothetical protein